MKMIRFEKVKELFAWDSRAPLKRNGRTSVFDATRKTSKRSDNQSARIITIEGLQISAKNSKGLAISLHNAISPMVSLANCQCDLVTPTEFWALKESKSRTNYDLTLLDLVLVEQNFGEDLEALLEESKVAPTHENIERLTCFLIRLLRMAQQRNVVISNLTPASIAYDQNSGFKLRGLFSGISSIYDTEMMTETDDAYCSQTFVETKNKKEEATWRENEKFCAGMTLLQFANQWKKSEVKGFRDEYATQKVSLNDRFSNVLPQNVLQICGMLLEGEAIDDIAVEYEKAYPTDCLGISTEDFNVRRNMTQYMALALKAKNEMEQKVDDLKAELERVKSSYDNQLNEVNTKLRQEAEEEKRRLELRICELSAKVERDEELMTKLREIVKKECDAQTTHFITEVNQRTSEMMSKVQSDHDTTLAKIDQGTDMIKKKVDDVTQTIQSIIDKMSEGTVGEIVMKVCDAQTTQIVKEVDQKTSEIMSKLHTDHESILTKIHQETANEISQRPQFIIDKLPEETALARKMETIVETTKKVIQKQLLESTINFRI
eukprot:TRINITY_DN3516_c0_g1_i7.p1 TRINITY_DN3516_c0_g1~~TRINITY_DN3516_c0_g1_i7.p1  ORF type:complete len:548 (-),score=101.32 TRINITY_DN3516_c0_g1_i7:347-1990(-)